MKRLLIATTALTLLVAPLSEAFAQGSEIIMTAMTMAVPTRDGHAAP